MITKQQIEKMSNRQAISLLFYIGNNINKIATNEEDVEIYLQAIECAINALGVEKLK